MQLTIDQILQQGIAAHNSGKLGEAERLYRDILQSQPNHPDANHNLGILMFSINNSEEALQLFKIAIEVNPNVEQFWTSYINVLIKKNQLEEAEATSRKAIELKPDFAEAHYNLGVILHEYNKLEEAEACYRNTISLKPDFAEAHNNLGTALKELGRLNESEVCYKKAIVLKPNFADAHYNLSNTLKELGKFDEAEENCRKAIKFKPDYAEAYNNLGVLLQEIGKLDEAETSFKKVIELNPDSVETHYNLCKIKNFNKEDEQFIQMQNLYLSQSLTVEQRCSLNFGLGKASEDLNQLDKSFKYYSEGNALRKKLLNYNIRQDIKLFDQLKKSYLNIKKNSFKTFNLANEPRPIFILGMPRSGTTLVEQIISSHSEVMGAGELFYVEQFGDAMARGISKIDKKILLNFRERYFKKLRELSNGNSLVTDKMTLNFRYIGLICSAFPSAKIIHVKRNAAATCWGNYKVNFTTKVQGYSYSYNLNDLITYYELYQDLMRFWEKQFGNRIYNLNYETLTINQEEEIRKLIKYLELKWEKVCLTPQDNKRSVATTSNTQIREKIYQDSSQKWKKFKPFLNGAFNHFED